MFSKWKGFSTEEKYRHFSKNACHELNLFLYFKDQAYFYEVVKPFIACKMEKTFIDYFLLEMKESIVGFASVDKISKLNVLEQCLLIKTLLESGEDEKAMKICNLMAQKTDCQFIDINIRNKVFDMVLNLNMLTVSEDKDDEIDQEGRQN